MAGGAIHLFLFFPSLSLALSLSLCLSLVLSHSLSLKTLSGWLSGGGRRLGVTGAGAGRRSYLTQTVFKVVCQKSTPPQIRQLILHYD